MKILHKTIRFYIPATIVLLLISVFTLTLLQVFLIKPQNLFSKPQELNSLPDFYNAINENKKILHNTDQKQVYKNINVIVLKERKSAQLVGYNAIGTAVHLHTFLSEAWKNKASFNLQNVNETLNNINKITTNKSKEHVELLNEGSIYSVGENYIVMGAQNFKSGYYQKHHPSLFENAFSQRLTPQEFFDAAFFHELGHNYYNYYDNTPSVENTKQQRQETSLQEFISHLQRLYSENHYLNNISEQFEGHEKEAYSDSFSLLMVSKKYPQHFKFYLNHYAHSRNADFMYQHTYTNKKLYTFTHATQFLPLFLPAELENINKKAHELNIDEMNAISKKVARKSMLAYISIFQILNKSQGNTAYSQIIMDIMKKNPNFYFKNESELQEYVLSQLPSDFKNKILDGIDLNDEKLQFSIFSNNLSKYISNLNYEKPEIMPTNTDRHLSFSELYLILLDKNTEVINPRFFNHFSLS